MLGVPRDIWVASHYCESALNKIETFIAAEDGAVGRGPGKECLIN